MRIRYPLRYVKTPDGVLGRTSKIDDAQVALLFFDATSAKKAVGRRNHESRIRLLTNATAAVAFLDEIEAKGFHRVDFSFTQPGIGISFPIDEIRRLIINPV